MHHAIAVWQKGEKAIGSHGSYPTFNRESRRHRAWAIASHAVRQIAIRVRRTVSLHELPLRLPHGRTLLAKLLLLYDGAKAGLGKGARSDATCLCR